MPKIIQLSQHVANLIAAGAVVLSEVPPNSTVVGVPGRVVKRNNQSLPRETMNQTDLPDPVKEDIACIQRTNTELTNRLLDLEEELKSLRRKVKKQEKELEKKKDKKSLKKLKTIEEREEATHETL